MNKKFSEVKSETLLIIFLSFTIIPFLILCFYNHPSAEDFFFWTRVDKVGFVNALLNLYNHWSGRFFSHSELLLNPLIFRSFDGYKFFTLFLMIVFLYVLFLFVAELTKKDLTLRQRILFSLSIFFLYFYKMPAMSEGFYWLISVPVYQNAIILSLIFFISYYRLNNAKKFTGKIIYTAASCFCVVAVAGSNEIAMSTMILISGLIAIVNLYKTKKLSWSLILIIISLGIASFIDIATPGTSARGENFLGKHQLWFSVSRSFSVIVSYTIG